MFVVRAVPVAEGEGGLVDLGRWRDVERDRRRAKFGQIQRAHDELSQDDDWSAVWAARAERAREAVEYLDTLRAGGDVEEFKEAMEAWSRREGYDAFRGFSQMFLNQLVKMAPEGRDVGPLLARVLTAPDDEAGARARIEELVAYVEEIKVRGQPAPKRVQFVCSLFWSLQEHDRWPCMWPSADQALVDLGWLSEASLADGYLAFREIVLDVGDPQEVERILYWFADHPFVGLDPGLLGRCEESADILQRFTESAGYSGGEEEIARRNAEALVAELRLLGRALQAEVAERFARSVDLPRIQLRTGWDKKNPYRADAYTAWALEGGMTAPGLRCWVTRDGTALGVYAGWRDESWYEQVRSAVRASLPEGYQFFRVQPHVSGSRLQPAGRESPDGHVFFGRWIRGSDALGRRDLGDEVLAVASDLRPIIDQLVQMAGGPPAKQDDARDELSKLVDAFLEATGYPTEKDDWNREEREGLAEALSPEGLEDFDLDVFRIIINSKRYGNPGPQSVLNSTLTGLDAAGLERFADSISYLLWADQEPVERRIDRLLDPDDLGFRGLGESVIMKLLAISHPQRFLPIFPYRGTRGKLRMLRFLGVESAIEDEATRGEVQVAANDLLRNRLEPLLPGDPWGQKEFMYWLVSQEEDPDPGIDLIADLADELLIDRTFLDELVELIEDKGQVVLYGPPGTGKTFVARRLAEALVRANPRRWMVVQFHPSTSYEDFFEGYRPSLDADGRLVYGLLKGPLANMASRAEESPGQEHVIVIDEINRANLPKVLGELLYLLEYRNEAVRTIYRPDDPFNLPKNVKFIGTMNTADRSIALIDAALRRRFHFVPFFPHEGVVAGLLRRWLEHHQEPLWIADLLDFVNEELQEALGGPHLQVGPSHFMKPGLTDQVVQRIWDYNIYPFIEEQFWGDAAQIERYTYGSALRRFRRGSKDSDDVTTSGEETTTASDTQPG